MLDAGAVLLGKTGLHELAYGNTSINPFFGAVRNPWATDHDPGGSSGGSAAAVSAGLAYAALGTETGCSIRQPAHCCGIVGHKPSYGLVSTAGVQPLVWTMDHVGPLTRSVEDAALVLNAIAGHDGRDSTSAPMAVPDFTANLSGDLTGMRLGVPREYVTDDLNPGSREAFMASIEVLKGLGATVDFDLSLPSTPAALSVYYILAPSEASANLARYDGVKYGYSHRDGATMWENMEATRGNGFGDEVKRRIMLGTYALSAGYHDAYYLKAQQVRTLIRQEFDAAFER